MLDSRANSIEYAAQLALITQGNKLVVKRQLGKYVRGEWADLVKSARLLDSLSVKDKMDPDDLYKLTYVYECLISSLKLNNLPVAASASQIVVPNVTMGIAGQQGPAGTSAYIYFAQADNESGTGFTTTFDANKPYLAFIQSTSPILSLTASLFAGRWFRVLGEAGADGNDGTNGSNGTNGTNGYSVLNGTVNPTSDVGVNGDFYINTISWQIFGPKASGTWPSGINLIGSEGDQGEAGEDGNTILTGITAPSNGLGNDGDIYLDTATSMLYGPKASGVWPAGVSLVGAPGEDGEDGVGDPGEDGVDAYLYIAYADDDEGNGFTTTTDQNKNYIAFLSSTVEIDSPIASDFTGLWVRFKGTGGDRWSTYSTTSMTIGTGNKTFTVEQGLAYVTGQRVVISDSGDFANRMEGYVTVYNTVTGQITVSVDLDEGSGTHASWQVSLQAGTVPAINTYGGASPTTETVGGIPAGTAITGLTYDALFEMLLVPFQLPSFTAFAFTGISSPVEVGDTLSGSVTATWSYTYGGNIATNSIDIDDIGNATNLITGTANDGSQSITLTSVTKTSAASHTWRITGTNTNPAGAADFTRDLTINWYWRRYIGTSTDTTLTESQIEALALTELNAGITGTFSLAAGGYKYFVWDDALGSPTAVTGFKDTSTNLSVAMADSSDNAAYSNTQNGWSYALVSVTNAEGVTSNKRVYRTKNILGGTITIQVS